MANLFADFLKPFTSGLAAPAMWKPNTSSPSSPFYNPPSGASPFAATQSKAPNQSTVNGAVYKAPPATPVKTATKTTAPAAAAPTYPAGTQQVTLPNGAAVSVSPQGGVVSAPPSFSIDVSKPVTSDVFASNVTNTDVQSAYAQYVKQLADAYKPTQDYLAALGAVQAVKARDAELDMNLLTGGAGGDTQGFAAGKTQREKGVNAIEGLRAEQALQVQELIRQGNIEAAKALVTGSQPRDLSYGQVAYNPLTGERMATGQTQPSFSASASPFGGYLIFDQRTGQYSVVGADALGGGGTVGGGGAAAQIPAFLQPAIGDIGGFQYIDAGKINSNQLPYAQQVAAANGIPLLTEQDASKVKEAAAAFAGADNLVQTIADNGLALIYANSPAQATAQKVSLEAQARIYGTQAKYFKDTVGAFVSLITRAAGEKGVLTTADVDRIRNALPNFGDTREQAEMKAQQLQGVLQSTMTGALSAYLGVPTKRQQTSGQIDMSAYAF